MTRNPAAFGPMLAGLDGKEEGDGQASSASASEPQHQGEPQRG